jgi:hypothetical protein
MVTCAHEPIAPEMARTKNWMKKGSKAHNALKEVVLNKRLRNDIKSSILQELPISVTLMVTNVSMCWLSMSSKE